LTHYTIRKATIDDLDAINSLVNKHKKELGFVRKVTISQSILQGETLIAESDRVLFGFVRYHHRLDSQTTLYDIVVSSEKRHKGAGCTLVNALAAESRALNKQFILLKCPEELPANAFYQSLGFERWQEDPGKRRKLVIWKLILNS